MMIHAINILKDPCSNADPIVLDTCTNSPADCPDNALKNCAENQLGTDGGNCFIQASDPSSINHRYMTSYYMTHMI